ncbi:DUF1722 domain-containing protein [Desulforhopalus vacuolatus]|uniref:DUF1722 domain-containing protein n=1 Tax=Desulforhopalus vacuolatus TaxID=40414 RepID=UPI0019650185|nr:DUF1722 domain-containing protein [Desulforhopalus vacuolatus]MBM9519657.1 DUF1722 domain-containing protein [Desulforhopalus vacuolatus]
MRIWDINPGFLNDQSLLGEHRELHGIHSIISKGKSGYSRHPETLRWYSHLSALVIRHELLVEEMKLREFNHYSPLHRDTRSFEWPTIFIDSPAAQYRLLQKKYVRKKQGRISLPRNIQELWAAHKYSVMARSPSICKEIGKRVAAEEITFDALSEKLVLFLRTLPPQERITNAVFHMWGYISDYSLVNPQELTNIELLQKIQKKSREYNIDYLLHSTALSELMFYARWPSFLEE